MIIKKHIFKIYLLMLLTFAFSNIEEGDLIVTEYFTVAMVKYLIILKYIIQQIMKLIWGLFQLSLIIQTISFM